MAQLGPLHEVFVTQNGENGESLNGQNGDATTNTPNGHHSTPHAAGTPLSWFQERLWVHYERSPEETSYNLPFLLLMRGDLNVAAVEQSLNALVARHESLRTLYGENEDAEAVQFVTPPRHVPLPVVPVDRAQLLDELERLHEHRFDLRQGPIFIARLLRLPDGQHLFLFNVHHIAADAWSLKAIMCAELQDAYAAFSVGQEPALPRLTAQYRDYARGQRSEDLSSKMDYWSEVLKGYEDSLELPSTFPRQRKSGTRSGRFVHRYPADFSRELERFSREHGCTMFMCLLAALAVTVSRYADKDDLCIGTTVSNRPDIEFERLIGFFVNILPLRMQIDEKSTVAELLKAVRAQVLTAFEHPAPFEKILQATDLAHRGGGNPLVPIVMRHQNFPETLLGTVLPPGNVKFDPYPEEDEADEAILKLLAQEHVPARCEIEMSYSGGAARLELEVVYAADLYDRAAIERLLDHHQHVLEGMFRDANQQLLKLPLLRDAEIAALLKRSDLVPTTEPPAQSFVERFDAQVAQNPDAVACCDAQGSWSYLDIARRAGAIAEALEARGTGPGDLVAVCLPRGGDLFATLFGIWRVGAAYVPIDPAYPTAYSMMIIADANPSAVVCDAKRQSQLKIDDSRCLRPTDLSDAASQQQLTNGAVHQPVNRDSLAYVMYTSGSTGKPKGVRVPHRQLDNWLSSLEKKLPFEAGEVVGQKTTSVFAAGVKEMFAGLLLGVTQVTMDDATVRDVATFVDALAEHRVTRLNILPSHLASVIEHLKRSGERLPSLKVCITAGEPLPKAQVLGFRDMFPNARLFNNYGCTELNDVTYYDTAAFDGAVDFVPIGTPSNTKVYVLDRHGRLVPDGHDGRALRAQPLRHDPSTRLFNTGDVVRHLPDGTLDYIGRWDFQVKVRGFRVDVRQVEQVMSDFEGIRARAVAFLEDRLPSYMVPDTFVRLDAMPHLPNGKLNRRALLETTGELQQSGAYEAPATPTERTLAGIWGVVVNVPVARIGRQTHFFEIGGHSLSAMRVLARIKDTFRVEVRLSELFDAPRLEAVAAAIDRQIGQRTPDESSSAAAELRRKTRVPGGGLLQDKVALITGGSRGIGLATALLLSEQGAKVAINYRDSKGQALEAKAMIEAEGGTAEVFGADVTNADQVRAMVAAVHAHFGPIDVLVANAHIHFRHRPFLEYDWADLEHKVNDELRAIFHTCQAVAPGMVRQRGGSIIAVSSTLSKRSNDGFLAQSTAKAAVDALVRSLATELGPHGIRVNTVAPGVTLTDAAMPMASHVKERVAAICPMRRNGLPEDMAGAITFLASDLSKFVNGTYIPVDGGFTTL
ncbi:hypothetical protein NEMBOFW57_010375 [Staphylotrichum longicolle]|uniref:Carrier domain-containing protein n=1 Tax=Staphylotrichum longicolle TaxID=669026 RepID=A0AAD4ERE2_9PEZI|nr:hypothetical protein NEMBOFW57_010375 [Staphylotrichum longicolle]